MPSPAVHSRLPKRTGRGWCALALAVLAGCQTSRAHIAEALLNSKPATPPQEVVVEDTYRIACPDVLEVKVANWPETSGHFAVGPDGRIAVPALGTPRVEGDTAMGLAKRFASDLVLPIEQVSCRVVSPQSRVVYVRGPITGGYRALPYQGPETVLGFIHRCGGLTPGADVRDVHVIRGNVARGDKPQVFAVDLEAILMHGDPKSNFVLQPFDELWIGELPRSKIGRAMPEWMRPYIRGFCEVFPFACPYDWREQIRDPER